LELMRPEKRGYKENLALRVRKKKKTKKRVGRPVPPKKGRPEIQRGIRIGKKKGVEA